MTFNQTEIVVRPPTQWSVLVTPKSAPVRSERNVNPRFPRVVASLAFAAFLLSEFAAAQGTREDYERSDSYSRRTRNLVFRDSLDAHWFGEPKTKFWYRVQRGPEATEYVLVNTTAGERRPAFDHERLAEQLSAATKVDVNPGQLRLRSLRFSDDAARCHFRFAGKAWTYPLPSGPLEAGDEAFEATAASGVNGLPAEARIARSDGGGEPARIRFDNRLETKLQYFWVMSGGELRMYGTLDSGQSKHVESYEGHAWLLKNDRGEAIASFVASSSEELATIDENTVRPEPWGKPDRGRRRPTSPDDVWRVAFEDNNVILITGDDSSRRRLSQDGSAANGYGGEVWWSPDSEHFVVMKTEAGFGRTIQLVDSSPDDSIHSRLVTVPYAKPGDRVDHPRPVLFSRADDWQPRMIDDALFPNPFQIRDVAWDEDADSFSFLYNERGHQTLRLITVEAKSAQPRITIDETSDTFICYSRKLFLHRIDASDELIWMSERSGWNHLYLLDAGTGDVKHAITSGDWVVRKVERVDETQRQLYLQVSGIDPDQDPYHVHLIRVDFDGKNLVRLTNGDGTHRWKFSPDEKYLIDAYSRVDLPPVTQLRDVETGKLICKLEQAEASLLLETGWRAPERFVAKGRDGQTDIHGIIVRPTNFDPQNSYPVLEHIYAGPHSSFVPKDFGVHSKLYSMAELGFIVVQIDGMGTSNRSKAFHDVCWKNLGDSGFPDRIAWMKAAAVDRPEMDLGRVGIWGGSAGGQSAMRALIAHGDFYHAAVADCGCHDNRVDKIWWNEQWMGWPIGPHYEAQSNVTGANRLEGDLMLIWGELDRNVDPASTTQVIDALIRADKDFEQLLMPGSGHGAAGHPYAKRRQADFFVRKLWHAEPRR